MASRTLEDKRDGELEMARITLAQYQLGQKTPTVETLEFATRCMERATELQRKIDKRDRRWVRSTTPTGVPVYSLPGTDLRIEADQRLSNFIDEADKQPRIHGWNIYKGCTSLGSQRKLTDAKATAERRLV